MVLRGMLLDRVRQSRGDREASDKQRATRPQLLYALSVRNASPGHYALVSCADWAPSDPRERRQNAQDLSGHGLSLARQNQSCTATLADTPTKEQEATRSSASGDDGWMFATHTERGTRHEEHARTNR